MSKSERHVRDAKAIIPKLKSLGLNYEADVVWRLCRTAEGARGDNQRHYWERRALMNENAMLRERLDRPTE